MPHFLKKIYILPFILLIVFSGCSKKELDLEKDIEPDCPPVTFKSYSIPIEGQYIVVFKREHTAYKASSASAMNDIMAMESESLLLENSIDLATMEASFGAALPGFSARLSGAEVERVKADPRVAYVAQDYYISLGDPHDPCNRDKENSMDEPTPDPAPQPVLPTPSTQTLPWGVERVGYANAIGKTAWILDSGIDFDHPDLNVDVARSKSFVTTGVAPVSAEDYHGHGTHVAGTVAAIDNYIGVVGVAAGATVVSVRVLDDTGSASISKVIQGVNYVATHAKAGDVANMSLGGGAYQPLDDAIKAAAAMGIYFVLAAGNESTDASNTSPARTEGQNIFTISAMNSADRFASFSNYGTSVDFCAPGVNVRSTYLNEQYGSLSGTSMAAPHVAGLLLITNGDLNISGYVANDPDGNADPIAHR